MFNFFNRKKVSIESISIPDFDWNLKQDTNSIKQWINDEQSMALSINYFDVEPDIPTIKSVDIIRKFYRDSISGQNGGVIESELMEIEGVPIIKNIFKIPQNPSGMTYLASLTIPLKKFSFVVKLQAAEIGMTGMRESIITSKLLSSGELSINETGYENWSSDPYDRNFKKGTLMNKSEHHDYDNQFPEHPLSKARKILSLLESKIEIDDTVKGSKQFGK